MHMLKPTFIYIHTYTCVYKQTPLGLCSNVTLFLDHPLLTIPHFYSLTFYPSSLALFFFMTLITACIMGNTMYLLHFLLWCNSQEGGNFFLSWSLLYLEQKVDTHTCSANIH